MLCSGCGVEVSERQKFCHECGAVLHPPAGDASASNTPDGTDDEPSPSSRGLLPTQPIATTTDPTELPTEPIATTVDPVGAPPEVVIIDSMPDTESAPASEPWVDAAPTTPLTLTDWPTTADASTATVTAEMPAIFDGDPDLSDYPSGGEPFKVRLIFVLALFGAAAVLMSMVATVIDLRTTRPEAGIVTGARLLEQLGTNLGLAGFVGAAVMVIGGLLACFGLRWGAGLAGGAGLALVGWAALAIGLAEFPIAVAESITRTSSELFTLRVTRDIGWWLIVGVGVVGALVFLASLRSIGSGGRAALNPLIAALTAVAAVILASGPLVPVNGASFAANFHSTDPTRDLPTAFFAGRLTQVALIATACVIGMLIVRSWGIGLAVGSLSVPVWLWVSSLGEIGTKPVGIADRNPGATTTVPNAVTTVGMVTALILLAVAAALATYRLNRSRRAA